jgi:ABC-type nitrate/sulfonate/bicarbonate transport system substrate-binding protein
LLTGAIDVSTVGYISNQPIVAETQGHPVNVIDPHSYGIRVGGNVVFTTEGNLRNKRSQIKRFLRAMVNAIELSERMPDEEVVDIVLRHNNKLDRKSEVKIWQVTKDQLLCKDRDKVGLMLAETWKETAELFHRYGGLKTVPRLEDAYTNELIEEILAERRKKGN